MKTLFLIRSIFRGLLLSYLLFRWFFVSKLSYEWDISSYALLAVGLGGMIIFGIIIYLNKKRGKL